MRLYQIKQLDASHNKRMLEILRSSPITTNGLTMCFDREPDIFAMPQTKYDFFQYLGFFREETLTGFALNGYHNALINNQVETVFHYTDLYVLPENRRMGFVFKISEQFFKKPFNEARYGYAIIMEGNHAALNHVGRRHPRYPYQPYSKIINKLEVKTIMLTWPVKLSEKYKIRTATSEDIPVIVNLLNQEHKNRLFGISYSEQNFKKNLLKKTGLRIEDYHLAIDVSGKIHGVCAAWDCTSFKQNRVINFGIKFLPARIAYRGLSLLFKNSSFPAKGNIFKDITITDYAVNNRNPEIMNALLRKIYMQSRKAGYHSIIWGSTAGDQLLQAAKGFFSQPIISNIILFGTKPELIEDNVVNNYLPYIDVACL